MRSDVIVTLPLITVAVSQDPQLAQTSLMRRVEPGHVAPAPSKQHYPGDHPDRAEIVVGDDGQGSDPKWSYKSSSESSDTSFISSGNTDIPRQSSGNFDLKSEMRSLLDASGGAVTELTSNEGTRSTGNTGLTTLIPSEDSALLAEVGSHIQQELRESGNSVGKDVAARKVGYHQEHGLIAQIVGGSFVSHGNLEALRPDHETVAKERELTRFMTTRLLMTAVAALALMCFAVARRDVVWQGFLWLRYQCGVDRFRGFEATIVVWEATYREQGELATCVRITIGGNSVFTESTRQGRFYRSFRLYVPQRVSEIMVELCDEKEKPLARVSFDPLSDILEPGGLHERLCKMNVVGLITDPNVRLTLSPTGAESWGAETEAVACSRLEEKKRARGGSGAAAAAKKAAQLEALAASCAGTLRRALPSGKSADCLVNVARTAKNGWVLRIWDAKGERPLEEIALCHVKEVKAESDGFSLQYKPDEKTATVLCFEGAAATWVDALEVLRNEE